MLSYAKQDRDQDSIVRKNRKQSREEGIKPCFFIR